MVDIDEQIKTKHAKTSMIVTKKCSIIYKEKSKKARKMIDLLVNRIILYDDKIEIYFNVTKDYDDNHQGSLFYKGVDYINSFDQLKQSIVKKQY